MCTPLTLSVISDYLFVQWKRSQWVRILLNEDDTTRSYVVVSLRHISCLCNCACNEAGDTDMLSKEHKHGRPRKFYTMVTLIKKTHEYKYVKQLCSRSRSISSYQYETGISLVYQVDKRINILMHIIRLVDIHYTLFNDNCIAIHVYLCVCVCVCASACVWSCMTLRTHTW